MLQPKLKVAVDYENAIPRNAAREPVLPFLNVPLIFGSKRIHMICPMSFRASVRIVVYVLSLAL